MLSRWRSALHRAGTTALHHRIVLLCAAGLVVLWCAFGLAIGGAPFFVLVAMAIIGLAFALLTVVAYRRTPTATAPNPTSADRRDTRLLMLLVGGATIMVLALIQLVPFGRTHAAGATTGEPQWANPETRALMVRACFSCHSNEVHYPWYSNVAPISWTVQHHIDEGRASVNYSTFATQRGEAGHTIDVIREGSMPPSYFTRFGTHPDANLSAAEKATLIAGLEQTPGLNHIGPDGASRTR
ncbi:MAG: heme-binding domain-containing protein [Acidimicrobiia bacterium]